jgi:Mn-dependent DtxR family transcriptional regulator
MDAGTYNDIVSKYKVRKVSFPYIAVLAKLSDSGERVSNLTISRASGVSPMAVGNETKKLSRLGLVVNKSSHPLWTDWKLTELGWELHSDFINYVEFPEKLSNEV